jgi:hypothetical protein
MVVDRVESGAFSVPGHIRSTTSHTVENGSTTPTKRRRCQAGKPLSGLNMTGATSGGNTSLAGPGGNHGL